MKGGLNLSEIDQLRELLHQKADIQARIKLIPYDGTPEIKTQGDKQYLYVRKRIGGRNTSTYVDLYSETLYQLLLKNARERRELEKTLRQIDRKLLQLGYTEEDLDPQVQKNLDFARINMKSNIYDQAIDKDVIQSKSDYYLLCYIAKQVNEGFFTDGGRIRGVPVTIGGCSYVPPLPIEMDVKEKISEIVNQTEENAVDTAIRLCLYCMRTQIFLDGNKRSAVIFANHYLISKGKGIIIIPEKSVSDFKRLLVKYYESNDMNEISAFIKKECWKNFE